MKAQSMTRKLKNTFKYSFHLHIHNHTECMLLIERYTKCTTSCQCFFSVKRRRTDDMYFRKISCGRLWLFLLKQQQQIGDSKAKSQPMTYIKKASVYLRDLLPWPQNPHLNSMHKGHLFSISRNSFQLAFYREQLSRFCSPLRGQHHISPHHLWLN